LDPDSEVENEVPVTIREIARLARVSKGTVSRVINGSGPVSDKTKRAVLEAISSADYQPSEIARSLILKRTNTIGLVVNDIRNPLFASNDYKALQVMRLFRKNGISVPEDMSLIGIDDIENASMVHPSLTTVHQPIDRMVESGSHMLLELLEGRGTSGERKVLRPWLVERESVRRLTGGGK
jgi:DNA-binding LacI/PurR family transcriptional regulator